MGFAFSPFCSVGGGQKAAFLPKGEHITENMISTNTVSCSALADNFYFL